MMLLNGEEFPSLFITLVRYVLPCDDHQVQKLLLLYLEMIEKTDESGKLLPEMILICQNLRNNLQHPNEYIRGVTLRFLTRITEAEIVEPLVPSILSNLEHRHSFVRRNAVLAIDALYKLPDGQHLFPDGPEVVERFMMSESDLSARRNAFLMLYNSDPDRAISYLLSNLDQVSGWGDILQMVALELIRKVCVSTPAEKGKYIKVILTLMNSQSTAVVYECAATLTSLSSAPTAVRAAAGCYCQLLISQSDNNVKLIVLDRITELKDKHKDVLQEMLMDILRALASPNMDIRKKVLGIAIDLITHKNIDEVIMTLKKEVVKTQSGQGSQDKADGEYRQLLVQTIHTCAVKFPDIAGNVIFLLMDFLGDPNTASAMDVVFFLREIVETNEKLRETLLARLQESLYTIRSSRVATCALWIIGEYSKTEDQIAAATRVIKTSLGPTPFVESDGMDATDADDTADEDGGAAPTESVPGMTSRPAVLADGSYATQTSMIDTEPMGSSAVKDTPNLRTMIMGGDFYVAAVVSTTLAKLVLRLRALNVPASTFNLAAGEAMMYQASMLHYGETQALTIDPDNKERISLCIKLLMVPDDPLTTVWLNDCRESFVSMIQHDKERELDAEKSAAPVSQPDDLIDFHHLKWRKGMSRLELEDTVASDLEKATGGGAGAVSRTKPRILQLTGFSDVIYAEANMMVHQYDIVLDITVLNRSTATLQNVCLELATMGDLKLVERPQNYTLGPGQSKMIRANIKVSSTESGVVFGNIVYESSGYGDRSVVVLNDIHIDIMDYINPCSCVDVAFRNMWAEFEWENKVAVNTDIKEVDTFLDHIVKSTNMKCLANRNSLDNGNECGFLAANLYAKSVFGEDALVNVSVEKSSVDNKLTGYIRIRSKTQGIALSLGDKITLKQKSPS